MVILIDFGLRTLDVRDFTLQACEKFWLFIKYFSKIRFHFFTNNYLPKKEQYKFYHILRMTPLLYDDRFFLYD